jgi:anti-sigma B factor antagonist
MSGPTASRKGQASEWNVMVAVSDGAARVVVRGTLDSANAHELDAVIDRVMDGAREIRIDLRGVTAMEAPAVEVVARHARDGERSGCPLAVAAPPAVAAELRAAGVARVGSALPVPAPHPRFVPRDDTQARGTRALRVTVQDAPRTVHLRLAGDLDIAGVPRLREVIDSHARAGQTMVVDLRGLGFVDSMGLAALVRAQHRALARGAQLELVAGPPAVQRAFAIAGLDRVFVWADATPASEAAGRR